MKETQVKSKIRNTIGWVLKISFLLLGILLLAAGGYFFHRTIKAHQTAEAMKKPLAQIPIDITVHNQYAVSLPAVQKYFHGIALIIESTVPDTEPLEPEQYLEQLQGSAVITDSTNQIVGQLNFTQGDFFGEAVGQGSSQKLYFQMLETFPEYAADSSRLDVNISRGAPRLKGTEQTLTIRYNLCGLEATLVAISAIFGTVITIIGLALAVPLSIHTVRRLKQANNPASGDAADS